LKKRIAILGSTGSIGVQTLEVIRQHPELFEVEVLSALNNCDILIRQAIEFLPNAVVIGNEKCYDKVVEGLKSYPVKVYAGSTSISQIVSMDSIDLVLNALVGFSGLSPTLKAIEAGKDVALANKESLVVAGQLVMEQARDNKVMILPVDSEHSAIFQCLAGEGMNPIEKIFLTASGGPFRGMTREQLSSVTREEALRHPRWKMGNKITIDSATLMNKGLEVIEAKWLFHLQPEQIEVVVHPQSVIHSMVQFTDGSIKAQMGLPDMKLPIVYAMTYPFRIKTDFPRFRFSDFSTFSFEAPDRDVFRCLDLAFHALSRGGNMPCILNAANEIAVAAFLNERITFLDIPKVIENCMEIATFAPALRLEDYEASDLEARSKATEYILSLCP
jgi:1-deoxy-D-xylulose-5-phosphate reductoisomerase